jgi:hypothetical protein
MTYSYLHTSNEIRSLPEKMINPRKPVRRTYIRRDQSQLLGPFRQSSDKVIIDNSRGSSEWRRDMTNETLLIILLDPSLRTFSINTCIIIYNFKWKSHPFNNNVITVTLLIQNYFKSYHIHILRYTCCMHITLIIPSFC